jgi:hypothetical protein
MIVNVGLKVSEGVKVPEQPSPNSDTILFTPHALCFDKGVYEIDCQVQLLNYANQRSMEVNGFYNDIRAGNTIVGVNTLSNGNLGILMRVDEKFIVPKDYAFAKMRILNIIPHTLYFL